MGVELDSNSIASLASISNDESSNSDSIPAQKSHNRKDGKEKRKLRAKKKKSPSLISSSSSDGKSSRSPPPLSGKGTPSIILSVVLHTLPLTTRLLKVNMRVGEVTRLQKCFEDTNAATQNPVRGDILSRMQRAGGYLAESFTGVAMLQNVQHLLYNDTRAIKVWTEVWSQRCGGREVVAEVVTERW